MGYNSWKIQPLTITTVRKNSAGLFSEESDTGHGLRPDVRLDGVLVQSALAVPVYHLMSDIEHLYM